MKQLGWLLYGGKLKIHDMHQRAGPLSEVASDCIQFMSSSWDTLQDRTEHTADGVRCICLGTSCPATSSVGKQMPRVRARFWLLTEEMIEAQLCVIHCSEVSNDFSYMKGMRNKWWSAAICTKRLILSLLSNGSIHTHQRSRRSSWRRTQGSPSSRSTTGQ